MFSFALIVGLGNSLTLLIYFLGISQRMMAWQCLVPSVLKQGL